MAITMIFYFELAFEYVFHLSQDI